MSAGRRSRASGTLVPNLELGNENLKRVVFTEKCPFCLNNQGVARTIYR